MSCRECDHCSTLTWQCGKCNKDVTHRFDVTSSHPLNEMTFISHYGSIYDMHHFRMYLCDSCVEKLFKFLDITVDENSCSDIIRDRHGNSLTKEYRRQ